MMIAPKGSFVRKARRFAYFTRLLKMSLRVDYRDHESVSQTVTHQWRHRRPQSCSVVVDPFSLANELNKVLLFSEEARKRSPNVRSIRPKNLGRAQLSRRFGANVLD